MISRKSQISWDHLTALFDQLHFLECNQKKFCQEIISWNLLFSWDHLMKNLAKITFLKHNLTFSWDDFMKFEISVRSSKVHEKNILSYICPLVFLNFDFISNQKSWFKKNSLSEQKEFKSQPLLRTVFETSKCESIFDHSVLVIEAISLNQTLCKWEKTKASQITKSLKRNLTFVKGLKSRPLIKVRFRFRDSKTVISQSLWSGT